MPRPASALTAFLVLTTMWGCSGGGGSPTSPTEQAGPLSFTVAPIDPATLQYIVPLGNMGPWAHTLPTDHAYFYHHLQSGTFVPVPVLAPAAGVVNNTYPGTNGEVKLWIQVNSRFTYYFDHLVPAPGMTVGARVEAGAVVGTSPGAALDFAVRDMDSPVGYIVPSRYGMDSLYGQSPMKYFVEPLRSQFYAKVQRVGGDPDGQVNFDVDGTLSGNWFAESLPTNATSSADMNVGTRQLAFARDVRFPDRQRVSIGGFSFTGLYGVPPDAPDFASITPASGQVVYRLLEMGEPGGPAGTRQLGLVVVELLERRRLRIEVVPEQRASTASFSEAAAIYVR